MDSFNFIRIHSKLISLTKRYLHYILFKYNAFKLESFFKNNKSLKKYINLLYICYPVRHFCYWRGLSRGFCWHFSKLRSLSVLFSFLKKLKLNVSDSLKSLDNLTFETAIFESLKFRDFSLTLRNTTKVSAKRSYLSIIHKMSSQWNTI